MARGRYRYAIKSELSKKLADIPVGAQRHGVYNYSHVLRPDQRAAGYSLEVHHVPEAPVQPPKPQGLLARMLGRKPIVPTPQPRRAVSKSLDVKLLHRGREVGSLTTHLYGKDLRVQEAKINSGHRGQEVAEPKDPRRGLGSAMYDAGLAHARNVAGAKYVVGDKHSSMASRAHQAVARRHGLDYIPEAAAPVAKPGAYDGAFKPYSYALKTEWDAGLHKSKNVRQQRQNIWPLVKSYPSRAVFDELRDKISGWLDRPLTKGFGHLPIPHAPQRTFLHLPVGTVDASTGKFLITSKEGRRIWKQGRMGVIRSREPATPAGGYGRPTSSRNPGS